MSVDFSVQFLKTARLIIMSNLVKSKDSQWLQLEVCREFQKNNCLKTDETCSNAHPSQHVEIINGKVIACYDSCKSRCNREVCKYYHPSSNLMEQLLLKGRNHLATKNELTQNVPVMPSIFIPVSSGLHVSNPEPTFKTRIGTKRSVDVLSDNFYPAMFCKRPALDGIQFPFTPTVQYQPIFQFPAPAERKFLLKLFNSDN